MVNHNSYRLQIQPDPTRWLHMIITHLKAANHTQLSLTCQKGARVFDSWFKNPNFTLLRALISLIVNYSTRSINQSIDPFKSNSTSVKFNSPIRLFRSAYCIWFGFLYIRSVASFHSSICRICMFRCDR